MDDIEAGTSIGVREDWPRSSMIGTTRGWRFMGCVVSPAMRASRVAVLVGVIVLAVAAAMIVRSVGSSGREYGPVGHHHLARDAPPVQAGRRSRHDRRLPLHAGQPSRDAELVHHLQPVHPREVTRTTTPPCSWCRRRPQPRSNVTTTVGKGWTCFGGPLPGTALVGLAADPLLTFWAPGHGSGRLPEGHRGLLPCREPGHHAGPLQPAGGQQAREELAGAAHRADSTPLLPLHLDLMLAPPNIPCPTGVTGPLCDRTASLANLGQRFGQTAVEEVNGIEAVCGENPSDPPVGDTASCSSSVGQERLHRQGVRPHAPPGSGVQDGAQPGDATGEDRPRCSRLRLPRPEVVQPGHPDSVSPPGSRCRSPAPTIRRWNRSSLSCARRRPTSSPGATDRPTRCASAWRGPRRFFRTHTIPSDQTGIRRRATRLGQPRSVEQVVSRRLRSPPLRTGS